MSSDTDSVTPEFVLASEYDPDQPENLSSMNKREKAREISNRVDISFQGNYIASSGNVSSKFLTEVLRELRNCQSDDR